MCALKRIAGALPKVTDKAFQRKFVALGKLVTRWQDIMGAEWASQAQPLKIRYRKPRRKGDPAEAILDIGACSAQASLMVMRKGLILARINHIFGETLVTDIRFVHQAPEAPHRHKAPPERTLNVRQKKSLSDMLNHIEDEEIKNRLLSMGTALLKEDQS